MNKRIKTVVFIAGLIILFIILQYDFYNDDSWKSWHLPLSGKVIILDPGHGGVDGGAGYDDALEKDIALNISLKLKDYLQEQGALVIMTRDEDKDLADEDTRGLSRRKAEDLRRRLRMINESEADFFVSIHLNAIGSSQWRGAQTFYSPNNDGNGRAARFIQDELRENLKNTNRKAKAINNVYLIKNSKKPGVLVEAGFLSNPDEKESLKDNDYQEKIAGSIYRGVLRHFSDEKELTEKED